MKNFDVIDGTTSELMVDQMLRGDEVCFVAYDREKKELLHLEVSIQSAEWRSNSGDWFIHGETRGHDLIIVYCGETLSGMATLMD
ncbi:hypothetical protein IIY24_00820 [Candidatus Saccharibacteria bacterium]|nr:hypothetical protein [Candidatus Saccharibacteria bacterium]